MEKIVEVTIKVKIQYENSTSLELALNHIEESNLNFMASTNEFVNPQNAYTVSKENGTCKVQGK